MGKQKRCDRERLSCFVDNALTPKEAADVKEHLKLCPDCYAVVQAFESLSNGFKKGVERRISAADTTCVGDKLFQQIRKEERAFPAKVADYFSSGKIVLQALSIAVIIAVSLIYYQGGGVAEKGPSAIVKLVDGNAASVIIFQTENENHTIIWYSET